MAIAALALAAAPAMAQMNASNGEAFLTALREGNGSKAYDLVDANGSTVVNYRGEDGSAALHVVVRSRNANWIGYLLANGADPDIGDKNGDTPLILAARTGYTEGVARLLMAHAQVNKTNKLGETALIVAVQQRQASIVSALLKLGANPDRADHAAGYSARDYAKRDSRSKDMLKLIETVQSRVPVATGPTR
jgi:ankyrin repeat protein